MMRHNRPGYVYAAGILGLASVFAAFVQGLWSLGIIAVAVTVQFFLLLQADARIEIKVETLESDVQKIVERESARYGPRSEAQR